MSRIKTIDEVLDGLLGGSHRLILIGPDWIGQVVCSCNQIVTGAHIGSHCFAEDRVADVTPPAPGRPGRSRPVGLNVAGHIAAVGDVDAINVVA